MGAWTDYNRLISTIISLKKYHPEIQDKRFDKFKQAIIDCQNEGKKDGMDIPTPQGIARIMKVPTSKVYNLIIDFHRELMWLFNEERPIEVENYVHEISIGISYDELQEYKDKKRATELLHKTTNVYLRLPVTPSVGDTIKLSFIDEKKKFAYGTVHSIHHDIQVDQQVITVDVHPFLPYYHKWKNDKEDYEYWERQKNRRD